MAHPAVIKYNHLVDNALLHDDPWAKATNAHKATAQQRKVVIDFVLSIKGSLNKAITQALGEIEANQAPAPVLAICSTMRKLPSKNTLRNWITAFNENGISALLPKYNGTARKVYGWEAQALELFHSSTKPSLAKVAKDLKEQHGYQDAQEHNVRYFIQSLPAELGYESPWRMGHKQYRDGLREHNIRTTENLPVGFLYQGDGHTIDVYVKHPKTGKLWRPELTVFMDVKSRYIVGWYMSVAESSISTMAALSHAIGTHEHVCAMVHVDHGSGFKSKMMNDKTAGFYASFDVQTIFALPGNAKAKNVERFFRTMEDDFGKDWDTYCGYAQSGDTSRHFSSNKIEKLEAEGKIHYPTLAEWMDGFGAWLERYHNRPHPEYKDETPASLWGTLEKVPVHDHNLLVKPRETVKVHRSLITLHGRQYRSDLLYQFNGMELVAEYDLHNDNSIRLFDKDGKWLTVATLKAKRDYLPVSRIDEAQAKRLEGQQKRLRNKMRENELRANPDITGHAAQSRTLEDSMSVLDEQQAPANEELDLSALAQNMIESSLDALDLSALDDEQTHEPNFINAFGD